MVTEILGLEIQESIGGLFQRNRGGAGCRMSVPGTPEAGRDLERGKEREKKKNREGAGIILAQYPHVCIVSGPGCRWLYCGMAWGRGDTNG